VTTFRIQERIEEWMADQLGKEDPLNGDDWGYAAALMLTDTDNGPKHTWRLMVTLRSPFLGQPPIPASIGLIAEMPPEQAVRHFAAKMVADLRAEFERRKRGMANAPGLNLPGLPGAMKQGPN
jgi:hypothetical protein